MLEIINKLQLKYKIKKFEPVKYSDGSNHVYDIGKDLILKIYLPEHAIQYESEFKTLFFLNQFTLDAPIPSLVEAGMEAGNKYLIISKLPGILLKDVWKKAGHEQKKGILIRIARLIKQLHQLDALEFEPNDIAWVDLLNEKLEKNLNTIRQDLPEHLQKEVAPYLEKHKELIFQLANVPQVILTGEFTPVNVLVKSAASPEEITGIIDFADTIKGAKEYELLGPLTFLAQGDKELTRAFLLEFGYKETDLSEELKEKLFVLLLLHRFSNFEAQCKVPGWRQATNLTELKNLIFNF